LPETGAFPNNFNEFYADNERRAGTYTFIDGYGWSFRP